MNYVPIPLAALESPGFLGMTLADQKFLIDLYVVFADCERFTIDMNSQEQYRQPSGATLQRKIRALLAAGLIQVVGSIGRADHKRRVFAFTYPAFDAVVVQQLPEAA